MTKADLERVVDAVCSKNCQHCMAIARAVALAALGKERDRHWSEFQDSCSTGSSPDEDLSRFHNCELHRLDKAIEELEGE